MNKEFIGDLLAIVGIILVVIGINLIWDWQRFSKMDRELRLWQTAEVIP
jgi:hypothetical protein